MRSHRRGATALTIAVSAGVLFAFVGIVVDFGVARLVQSQLQAATDVSAMAGARQLDGTAAGLTTARTTAVDVAAANFALSTPVTIDPNPGNDADGDVVVGIWDEVAGEFTPSMDPARVDAVQVRARRDDLRTWFLALFGRNTLATRTRSIAERGRELGAGRVPWYLPFSLPECEIDRHTADGLADLTFVLSPAGDDTTGWGAVGDNPNASWAVDHIEQMMDCMHDWEETGEVDAACSQAGTSDYVNLGNGEMTSALKALEDAMKDGLDWSTERWGALPAQNSRSTVPKGVYGSVLEGPIPIFQGGADYCGPRAAWNETYPVLGFVWGVIYDVASKGSAAQRNVWVRVDTRHIYTVGEWYGGGAWGVTYNGPPVLTW
jgi:hypothetical protein